MLRDHGHFFPLAYYFLVSRVLRVWAVSGNDISEMKALRQGLASSLMQTKMLN